MLKNKRLKSLIFGLTLILTISATGFVANAAAGAVRAYASFHHTGDLVKGYTFYGSGRAEETVEAPSNIKNIYARDKSGTILASAEKTEHKTTNAYVSCSYDIKNPYTKNRASTLARARYVSDNSVSQSIVYTKYADFTPPDPIIFSDSLAEEFQFDTTGLIFIPGEAFTDEGNKTIQVMSELGNRETFALIFGDHFMAAKVGDTLPKGVYINKDGSEAYVFDKKDGSIIMSTYEVNGSKYKVINTNKKVCE